MTRRRLLAVSAAGLTMAGLTMLAGVRATPATAAQPVGSAAPPPAAAPVPAGSLQAGSLQAGSLQAGSLQAGAVPCPKPKAIPVPGRPKRPVPPPSDPALMAVGGSALATRGLVVPSGAPRPPALTATSWLVADLDTGQVLGGCGPHVYGTPASVQKLLLAATVMAKLDPKRVTKITRKDLDFEPGSSAVGLLEGGKYSVRTLWLGLLLNSGNDAANTLARLGGGAEGVPGTIAAMNAEAHRLGAFQTHAVTPSGLDGPGQFTSAYDLALIARACFERPDFQRYALTEHTQIPAQPPRTKRGFQIQNENQLIYNYPGALGGKTGFTTLARHSYVGAAERGDRRLVATLLGAEARPKRGWEQGAALLDWGFSLPRNASVGQLVSPAKDSADGPPTSADGPSTVPEPSSAGARPASRMALGIAAAVAVVLAATPLALLVSTHQRRLRRRVRRRHPETGLH